MSVSLYIPVRTVSLANAREHWATRARRTKAEHLAVLAAWAYGVRAADYHHDGPPRKLQPDEKATVRLTRVAPRELDDDNLRPALKGVRDALADLLGLPNDRDPRVAWEYAQGRGDPKVYAVRVLVSYVF